MMEGRFCKRLFSSLFHIQDLSPDTLANELKSAVLSPQVVLRQERKAWIRGGRGVGKTGSFDHSWSEPMRVSPSGLILKKAPGNLRLILSLSLLKGESVHAYDGWLCATVEVNMNLLIIKNRLLGLLQAKAERKPMLFLLLLQHPNHFPSARASN